MTEDQKVALTRLAMILETGQAENRIALDRQAAYAEALRALLSTSIADTAGAIRNQSLEEAAKICDKWADHYGDEESTGQQFACDRCADSIRDLFAAPPAPSVADAAGASEVHIATVYEDNDGTKHVQLDVENFDDLPVGMKLYARYENEL